MTLLALALAFLPAAAAIISGRVDYHVTNNSPDTPGGDRFDKQIGIPHTTGVIKKASSFIWTVFHQPRAFRKPVHHLSVIIDGYSGVAYTSNNKIHLSATYIAGVTSDLKNEIDGILYHEATHVWQWNGNGKANGGLIEGIADFVRLRAGLGPAHWVKPGEGERWDQGYDVTARFLDYCDGLGGGKFVARLNRLMKHEYSDGYFG